MVVTPGVANARSNPFSFTTIPIISGGSIFCGREALNLDITSSLSAICFTCFGETKLTASMWRNPASTSSFKYSALCSVGMKSARPCQASRGHSMIFVVSSTAFLLRDQVLPEEVEEFKVQELKRLGLTKLCHLPPLSDGAHAACELGQPPQIKGVWPWRALYSPDRG